jgi:hypothetical protein
VARRGLSADDYAMAINTALAIAARIDASAAQLLIEAACQA